MHLISFDASPRQLSKLRNGHPVRIKKGSGFNLVVNPSNYHLVSRAFGKNKGIELTLSPDELDVNKSISPEQHDAMAETVDENLFTHKPYMEGGSIFKKIKKALHSKTAKKIGRELKPLTRELRKIGREIAHEKIGEAHMSMVDKYGDNQHAHNLLNVASNLAHEKVGGKISFKKIGKQINKTFNSKTAKKIGRELKPLSRALKSTGKDLLHEYISQAHMQGADQYGTDPRMAGLMNVASNMAHEKVQGMGLGAGLYAYPQGRGMNAHDALRLSNIASAHANHQLAKMHNATVHGQITQPSIKSYWEGNLEPMSRGYGLHNHMNMIRGRGSMISQDHILPPALQSQPYGANFQFQHTLPPQYQKFSR